MLFALQTFTTLLAFLSFGVHASPLNRRDVIAPKIIKPDASSVWPVGSVQTVTWDTSNFPPDSQITNPIGQVILGFDENDSLNLDFEHPLAKGFKLRDGSVQLTVPDVPPRDDYLIVLFGDSGNTSPSFAITRISTPGSPSNGTSSSISSTKNVAPPNTSTLITDPIPITGTTITGGTGATPSVTDVAVTPLTTSTSPSSTATQTTPTTQGTAGASNNTGAAWSVHHSGAWGFKALSFGTTFMVMLLMV
ncbi:hypothetical protein B0H34DRAFT_709277 [Crassisporium funariophilum]|nr:hypothetical protein B0H34DRAFT_709277 [Crassisporium funariophilum]